MKDWYLLIQRKYINQNMTQFQKRKSLNHRLLILGILAIISIVSYLLYNLSLDNQKLFWFVLTTRIPKVVAMLVVAICVGLSSLIFQSIIGNKVVTPSLLGMSSLYTLIHTVIIFFFGSSSILARNTHLSFFSDLVIMTIVATIIYGYLFKKTKYNVLYVLLMGTVLTSLFSSLQSTMVRIMDPNEYDALLSSLVASFNHVNSEIIIISIGIIVLLFLGLKKELALLDVISLGKNQAINLGVDYDRTIRKLLLGVVLFIAVSTALVGPVSFIGLIVANLSRNILKTYRHIYLVTGSILLAIIALVGGQMVVEHIVVYAIPLSVFISIVGGVYFLFLILWQKGEL